MDLSQFEEVRRKALATRKPEAEDPAIIFKNFRKLCYYYEKIMHQRVTQDFPILKLLAFWEEIKSDPEYKTGDK